MGCLSFHKNLSAVWEGTESVACAQGQESEEQCSSVGAEKSIFGSLPETNAARHIVTPVACRDTAQDNKKCVKKAHPSDRHSQPEDPTRLQGASRFSITERTTHWLWPRRSSLCIGAYDSSGYEGLPTSLWDLYKTHTIVEPGPINNAIQDIPVQQDNWSCGINSAGRFMAMLGYPYADFSSFHHHSPNHPAGHKETGPGTLRLASYMIRHHDVGRLWIGANMTDEWESQRDLIDRSLALSRPAMILVEVASRNLHWVNVIGRDHREPRNYIILDTDGRICAFPGGELALRARMDLHDHVIHSIPLRNDRVARFNSITATNGELPEERCNKRNMSNGHATLRGNRSAAHNITNTLFDNPITLATPLAPVAILWRLF